MGHFSFGDAMKNLVIIHVVLSALVVAAVVATPVERTNGGIGIPDEDSAPEDSKHLTAANRGFPNQHGAFLPYSGNVMDVKYEGKASYHEPAPHHAAPHKAPAYHAPVHKAPAYHAPVHHAPIYHA